MKSSQSLFLDFEAPVFSLLSMPESLLLRKQLATQLNSIHFTENGRAKNTFSQKRGETSRMKINHILCN